MSEKLCKLISAIDNGITVTVNNSKVNIKFDNIKDQYCTGNDKEECLSYEALVSSIFTKLIKNFMNVDDLKKDKCVEYAILWLCYKLNLKTENEITTFKEIYNNYLKDDKQYIEEINGNSNNNANKNLIDNKINSMNMDFKDISDFYDALTLLCKMYTGCNEKNENYTSCSQDAQNFANEFNNLNDDNRITGNNLYREILSSLFNNYDNFKNGCAKKCSGCTNIPILPEIKAPASSLIASKLIPVLLTFSIAFFLGVAYKYSLFGFDKRLQRIYPREKLKKIKKKMNRYI
ncbi:Plasmodium variant antigen protein Cir/Yir/Bir, putative [Plasmodium chabaudi chabaudi]|uniref:Plasmodium variant antigen protein Cir/Yir/Bir, putative n=1 Tax=Plasmodium chabaudi chabaudi TaxID=31271 RepID=A0A1C6WDL8_PLACU|nr:Plasmodium variant antigen protein Cir/Yir/Bir, putative [Plasmodium chabaudi chabaudi]